MNDNVRSVDDNVRSVIQFWTWMEYDIGTLDDYVLFVCMVDITAMIAAMKDVPMTVCNLVTSVPSSVTAVMVAVVKFRRDMVTVSMIMEAAFASVSSLLVTSETTTFVTAEESFRSSHLVFLRAFLVLS